MNINVSGLHALSLQSVTEQMLHDSIIRCVMALEVDRRKITNSVFKSCY